MKRSFIPVLLSPFFAGLGSFTPRPNKSGCEHDMQREASFDGRRLEIVG